MMIRPESLPSTTIRPLSDFDLLEAKDMGKRGVWANLDEPIYAEKDFKIYRPPQQQSSLPVYYVKGRLPHSADTLFNTIADVRYRQRWDKLAMEVTELDATTESESSVVYFATHSPWPLAKRDYVYQRRTKYFAQQNAFVMISQAAHHTQAPPETSGVVRVESFTMRLSIRSTGTSSCKFYMEYRGESNLSIPNFALNWLLRVQVPSFLSALRKACAKYSNFLKTLDDAAVHATPASMARLYAEESQTEGSSLQHDGPGNAHSPSSTMVANSSSSASASERREPQLRSDGDGMRDAEVSVSPERVRRRDKFFRRTRRDKSKESPSSPRSHSRSNPFSSSKALASRSPSSTRPGEGFGVESHNILFSCDGVDLLKLFQSLDDDAYTGAVLQRPLEGKKVTEDPSGRRSPRTRSNSREDVLIPEGAVLQEVDSYVVASLPFAEIIQRLSRNENTKVLSFKPPRSVTADGDYDASRRRALSRKLSSVFRWKSSDDSPMGSPVSKARRTKGFKSATATETGRVKSAKMASDQDESRHNGGENEKCLLDYSEVTITAKNISWAWEHVHLLKTDERVLSAAMLIEKIEAFLKKGTISDVESTKVRAVSNAMDEKHEWIQQIKERRTQGVQALHEFNSEEDGEWNFAQTYFGVSTHWKPGADGTVWLKLEGLVEGVDSFNTLSVIREIDLFKNWAPFCSQSRLLHQSGFVDLHAYLSIAIPLLKRDLVLRAVGINASYESGCVLLLGESVDDDQLPSNVEAPRLKDWGADRAEMRAFRVLIEPITRTKSRACVVSNIDPKCPVPKSLLNFSIKKMAGVMLFLIRKEAEKIEKAMQEGAKSDHVARLKDDPDGFYAWLGPLFEQWFEDQRANRLPPLLKFPKPSERNTRDDTASGRNGSVSSSCRADLERKNPSQSRSRTQKSSRRTPNGTGSSVVVSGKRTWLSYLLGFGIWPYILLATGIFVHIM